MRQEMMSEMFWNSATEDYSENMEMYLIKQISDAQDCLPWPTHSLSACWQMFFFFFLVKCFSLQAVRTVIVRFSKPFTLHALQWQVPWTDSSGFECRNPLHCYILHEIILCFRPKIACVVPYWCIGFDCKSI